jgi:glycosyltransferase involved in cell wall biosynthesis
VAAEREPEREEDREQSGTGDTDTDPRALDPVPDGDGLDDLHRQSSGERPRRPRLLLVITLAEVGGAQSYLAALLPALTGPFDVTVAAHGMGPLREAAASSGAQFVPLRHVRRAINPWRDVAGLFELLRLVRRERPDILHASSSKAGVLARLAAALDGVPIRIFTAHGWAFGAQSGSRSRLYRWADRLMRPLTTVTICVAERERTAGVAAHTCDAAKTVVIPNAVDVEAAPVSTVDRPTPRIVSVGRLKAPKDFQTLARALSLLPQDSYEALIVGDGPDRPAIQRRLRQLALEERVHLVGARDDVPAVLAEADVFVLSSRSEGMPVSVIEAMAAGLPVVASHVGGMSELVEDGETGFLVPPEDPTALTRVLATLLEDQALRRRLGDAGRERARREFDLDPFRRAHVELYSRELAKRGLPAPIP